jgi:hypothetical protein
MRMLNLFLFGQLDYLVYERESANTEKITSTDITSTINSDNSNNNTNSNSNTLNVSTAYVTFDSSRFPCTDVLKGRVQGTLIL